MNRAEAAVTVLLLQHALAHTIVSLAAEFCCAARLTIVCASAFARVSVHAATCEHLSAVLRHNSAVLPD